MVEYVPDVPFLYGKPVDVGVYVRDVSSQHNWLRDGYTFYVINSISVGLLDYSPAPCVHGVQRFNDVSFIALDLGHGVDKTKLRLQVQERDITDDENTIILPIIYRVL